MVRRRSWLTAVRTCSTFEGVVAVLGRPDRTSLAVEVLPFLKSPNHSKVQLRLMHESPKACFNISKVLLPVLPNLTQNLTHTFCSSPSAIPSVSENRRRLIQYTKTRATIKRHHIQPRHSAHSQDTTATHPSGKLVNYKLLACYEHCPGTFDTPSYYVPPGSTLTNFTFCPHSVFMCFVWI